MTSIDKIYDIFSWQQKVSTDSRKIEKGCLFFALKGENFNGNKYAQDAIKKGAAIAIIDDGEYESENTILVDNVLNTLQELAAFHRKKLGIPILAITGTNGKTTTKELISTVLAQKFNISFTKGNLNNHIGVPLTLLNMDANTEFGVVEMGANHPGEIAALCRIANPNYGIITNIGKAHLEGFGSFEGVIKTKGELYEYINENNGIIFINNDNEILKKIGSSVKNQVSYGKINATFCGEPIDSPPFVHVKANFPKGILYLNTSLTGSYNFENILAAACIGNYFSVDPLKIQEALKKYTPTNSRSQLINRGNLKVTMDAYNANPTSMNVSIESFNSNMQGKKYFILGDMLELGKYSNEEHENILKKLRNLEPDDVFLVGPEFKEVNNQFHYKSFENVEELCSYFEKNKIKNGNILIKGSRGIQLEKVLEFLN